VTVPCSPLLRLRFEIFGRPGLRPTAERKCNAGSGPRRHIRLPADCPRETDGVFFFFFITGHVIPLFAYPRIGRQIGAGGSPVRRFQKTGLCPPSCSTCFQASTLFVGRRRMPYENDPIRERTVPGSPDESYAQSSGNQPQQLHDPHARGNCAMRTRETSAMRAYSYPHRRGAVGFCAGAGQDLNDRAVAPGQASTSAKRSRQCWNP
jgi:hypothetical protein